MSERSERRIRYETEVVRIGATVPEFIETGIVILFGEAAPAELHDICVLHRPSISDTAPEPGDLLQIGGEEFTVTAVGSVVEENLLRLGHASLKADGATQAALPGDISIEARPLPLPSPGSTVRFVSRQSRQSEESEEQP